MIDPIAVAAEHIDDLLTQLGVDAGERQTEDVHGVDTEMGEDVKTIIARAVVEAYLEFHEQLMREGFTPEGAPSSVHLRPLRHPRHWQSMEIKSIQSGQPRPYADSQDVAEVTFTGGCPSSYEGTELPFATRPPFRRELHENTSTQTIRRIPPRTIDELEREHYDRVKALVRPFICWQADKTIGEIPGMGQSWLAEFRCIASTPFETTYRVTKITPYMD